MKRKFQVALVAAVAALGLVVQPLTASAAPTPPQPTLTVGKASDATANRPHKINIMGIFAHPDDEAGLATPCGVWHDRYGITCGIIMVTRGEGGSNSVGSEAGPALGLRRENEDRTSHVRSGTIDIFNLDRVDFFYNTSAPLTAQVWDTEETLRRAVRIIRETQPDILLGWTPSLAVGHGNHQYAQGRLVWTAAAAAADPKKFPEQLTGVGAVKTWQVKKILADMSILRFTSGITAGTGGTSAPNCNTGFVPDANNPFTVVGTWTGYESPYTWAAGNTAGQPAGSAKTWAQVGGEGAAAHATQARSMQKGVVQPTCQRFGVLWSGVPLQPNAATASAKDNAILYGAVIPDPGGMPLGSTLSVEPAAYYQSAGEPFTVTVSLKSGKGTLPAGKVALNVPSGWKVSGPVKVSGVGDRKATTARFTVTPTADAANAVFKLGATYTGGRVTGYNDTRVELVSGIEGRFQRWGNLAEYEQWMADNNAYVGGRSTALGRIGAGESVTETVEVTNHTQASQSGTVTLTVPDGFVVDATSKPYGPLAAGQTTSVDFVVTSTDPSDPGGRTVPITAVTSYSGGQSSETLTMYLVPSVTIPQLAAAPAIDGVQDDLYTGDPLSLAKVWEGEACAPDGVDCGTGSVAQLGWFDDALYAHVHVTDDVASAAASPERCFGHWLVDSVEVLLDPRGNSADTSTTFKLGVFPYTDDPTGANGNGVDGPCWERDADNHQGFATGPLAATVEDAPNAPGVEVVSRVDVSGGKYTGGGYDIELKIPLADLPAAVGPTSQAPTGNPATNVVDPTYLGLNVTPYDSDTQDFIGQTRNAWSAFGSQQSEPYRWGHAYLAGYTPPTGRTTVAPPAIIPDTALEGVESPQTIYQSAVRGVTMSGLQPSNAMKLGTVSLNGKTVRVDYRTSARGTARVYVWTGDPSFVKVWKSSCAGDVYGFDACSASDGTAAPWAPDMGGHLLGSTEAAITRTGQGTLTLQLDADAAARLGKGSYLLVSFIQSDSVRQATKVSTPFGTWYRLGRWPFPGHKPGASAVGSVNAWSFPVVEKGRSHR
ncbi:MAG: sugar-binding protein [Propionicimonas sp.]|uniref:PIG-L family deacetylase n=1 Tax=Propionicimonas sp. TaxID=1955623 RepID=UPI002B21D6D6|nr:PIG-L family deacetylase [Propionicimonas sp.]MEA4944237.1 sugar-binding protein [Propionicimonas sp.]